MELIVTKGTLNDVNVEVVPQPQQTIVIDRGIPGPPGPPGPPGASTIGGYPVNIIGASNYDALMFLDDEWTNIPQTEITDGGNF